MSFQNVFQCEGCGNVYQSGMCPASPIMQPPQATVKNVHGGHVRILGLGQSDPYVLTLEQMHACTVPKVLCKDCASAVERAIAQTLARL